MQQLQAVCTIFASTLVPALFISWEAKKSSKKQKHESYEENGRWKEDLNLFEPTPEKINMISKDNGFKKMEWDGTIQKRNWQLRYYKLDK